MIKNMPAVQEPQGMRVQSLGKEDPLEEGMATDSSSPRDSGAWWDTVHRVTESDMTYHACTCHIQHKEYCQFSSVQLLSRVRLFATPWTAARQASLSVTNSWSLFKLMSIESVMSFNQLILCHPLLLLPSIFPSIRVFSNESVLPIR